MGGPAAEHASELLVRKGDYEGVERQELHQPGPREYKGNTVVEGVRQLADGKHVGERHQAVGACPVDLIECLGCYRRSRTSHLLKPGDDV